MGLRDGGCVAEGCDWPPWMCHAHHWTRWTDGGTTDLDQGGLLCPRHHARAHDPTYQMQKHPNGKSHLHPTPMSQVDQPRGGPAAIEARLWAIDTRASACTDSQVPGFSFAATSVA